MNDYEANAERTCERIPMPDEPTKEARTDADDRAAMVRLFNGDWQKHRPAPAPQPPGAAMRVDGNRLVVLASADELPKWVRENIRDLLADRADLWDRYCIAFTELERIRSENNQAMTEMAKCINDQRAELARLREHNEEVKAIAGRLAAADELARLRDENAKLKGA